MHKPLTEPELCELISAASAGGGRLSLHGGGSKREVGNPAADADALDLTGFHGVVDYDPGELVLTVRSGTPLAVVQALVAAERQMLAFDPFDHGPFYGRPSGAATIGGVVAAGVSGSRRLALGGARDHVLGVRAVSGRGELFVSGARVVKNVTGYDLPKLIAGSWGRLAAITELTLKVLPSPRMAATWILQGLQPETAVMAMSAAMGSTAEVVAAAHVPGRPSVTAFRLQGFPASVEARSKALAHVLEPYGRIVDPGAAESDVIWDDLRSLSVLPQDQPVWRVNVPPMEGGGLVRRLERSDATWVLDWAGGLAWIATSDAEIRNVAVACGGHATVVRGQHLLPHGISTFQPLLTALAVLETRVRRAFDPNGVFETGRF